MLTDAKTPMEDQSRLAFPVHLHYELSRAQRLIPHLALWGPASILILVIPLSFLSLFYHRWFFVMVSVLLVFLFRGLFIGVLNVLLVGRMTIDLLIEENGLGAKINAEERQWMYQDGIVAIRQYLKSLWTVQHHNGAVLHIPTSEIAPLVIDHMKAVAAKGRTKEQIEAVCERGRLIQGIEQNTRAMSELMRSSEWKVPREEVPDGLRSKSLFPGCSSVAPDGGLRVFYRARHARGKEITGEEHVSTSHPKYQEWYGLYRKQEELLKLDSEFKEELLRQRQHIDLQPQNVPEAPA